MDRISALRNVEEAVRAFERGEADLAETERRVATVLRTYASEFETADGRAAYRVAADDREAVVVAGSAAAARERGVAALGGDDEDGPALESVTVERVA
jgi:Tfp pilus assembly protein PilX